MPLVNVAELISDPDFNQGFGIIRRSGSWVKGRFTVTEIIINADGVVIPEQTKGVDLTPQGSLLSGRIHVWTYTRLYVTSNESTNSNYLSDKVIWQGKNYLVENEKPYNQYGYYKYDLVAEEANS